MALRDVPLRPPGSHQETVLHDSGEVVQEALGGTLTVDFLRLCIGKAVAGADELPQVLYVRRNRARQKVL
jgi:hypothetical protein